MYKFQDQSLDFKERAKDLVSHMTLEEKVAQIGHIAPAIPRLGVPAYVWWNESLHGVARSGVATMFPQAIGMAAAFDEDLIHGVADVISTEGRAKYHEYQRRGDTGIYKGLTFWSPNINIFRDPRWGRGQETYGEDPYLTGRLGVAYVKGIQGGDKKYLKAAAAAKHLVAHSGPENERHGFNAEVSQKDLRETYMPAFRDLVKEARVECMMGAYNRTNGEPCCGSKHLIGDILRGEWGFDGYFASDCWAIRDFHLHHMVTKTVTESAALALNSGCDMNCGNIYINLLMSVKEGLTDEAAVTQACERVMVTRMRLGMFDDADKVPFSGTPYSENDSPEHHELSFEASKKTLVLLKNEGGLLPLDRKQVKSIAVIGPHADSRDVLTGSYCGTSSHLTTVLQGIRAAAAEGTRVYYAPGCHLFRTAVEEFGEPNDRLAEAIADASAADITVLCLGLDATIEGEQGETTKDYDGSDKKHLDYPGMQQHLLEKIYEIGKPVILINFSGSALAINWADEHIPAIVQAWYPGAEGGRAIASLIFGDHAPEGKLPVTFYRSMEELPDFSDYSMKGRTYRYMQTEALYPFGYGLSYTTFKYSNATVSATQVQAGGSVTCGVEVTNTGKTASTDKVQLYLKDVEASVDMPRWSLRGFKPVTLAPGQTKTVTFELTARDMSLIDNDGKRVLEPGKFIVYMGGSQPDARSIKLTGSAPASVGFEMTGAGVTEIEY